MKHFFTVFLIFISILCISCNFDDLQKSNSSEKEEGMILVTAHTEDFASRSVTTEYCIPSISDFATLKVIASCSDTTDTDTFEGTIDSSYSITISIPERWFTGGITVTFDVKNSSDDSSYVTILTGSKTLSSSDYDSDADTADLSIVLSADGTGSETGTFDLKVTYSSDFSKYAISAVYYSKTSPDTRNELISSTSGSTASETPVEYTSTIAPGIYSGFITISDAAGTVVYLKSINFVICTGLKTTYTFSVSTSDVSSVTSHDYYIYGGTADGALYTTGSTPYMIQISDSTPQTGTIAAPFRTLEAALDIIGRKSGTYNIYLDGNVTYSATEGFLTVYDQVINLIGLGSAPNSTTTDSSTDVTRLTINTNTCSSAASYNYNNAVFSMLCNSSKTATFSLNKLYIKAGADPASSSITGLFCVYGQYAEYSFLNISDCKIDAGNYPYAVNCNQGTLNLSGYVDAGDNGFYTSFSTQLLLRVKGLSEGSNVLIRYPGYILSTKPGTTTQLEVARFQTDTVDTDKQYVKFQMAVRRSINGTSYPYKDSAKYEFSDDASTDVSLTLADASSNGTYRTAYFNLPYIYEMYVDANVTDAGGGSLDKPFNSLATALTSLQSEWSNGSVTASDATTYTVNVMSDISSGDIYTDSGSNTTAMMNFTSLTSANAMNVQIVGYYPKSSPTIYTAHNDGSKDGSTDGFWKIDGGSSVQVLNMDSDALVNLTLKDLVLQNSSEHVEINSNSSLKIDSCVFSGFTSSNGGGAIYNSGTLNIYSGIITGCRAISSGSGGAIYNNGIITLGDGSNYDDGSEAGVKDVIIGITDNWTTGNSCEGGSGGAIYSATDLTIGSDCIVGTNQTVSLYATASAYANIGTYTGAVYCGGALTVNGLINYCCTASAAGYGDGTNYTIYSVGTLSVNSGAEIQYLGGGNGDIGCKSTEIDITGDHENLGTITLTSTNSVVELSKITEKCASPLCTVTPESYTTGPKLVAMKNDESLPEGKSFSDYITVANDSSGNSYYVDDNGRLQPRNVSSWVSANSGTSPSSGQTLYVVTIDDLQAITNLLGSCTLSGVSFDLQNDIDCSNTSLEDSSVICSFSGTFDGQNHTLSNFSGHLFMQVGSSDTENPAIIRNLIINGAESTVESDGAFAQEIYGSVTFEKCLNQENISSSSTRAGGFAGSIPEVNKATDSYSVIFNSCENTGTISASDDSSYSGGFIGYVNHNAAITFTNCSNLGDVSSPLVASGFIGSVEPSVTTDVAFSNSCSSGSINNAACYDQFCYIDDTSSTTIMSLSNCHHLSGCITNQTEITHDGDTSFTGETDSSNLETNVISSLNNNRGTGLEWKAVTNSNSIYIPALSF